MATENLAMFLQRVAEQVLGGDERELLYAWLARAPAAVLALDVDLTGATANSEPAGVWPEEGQQLTFEERLSMGLVQVADEDDDTLPAADDEAVELADLEGRLADRVAQWLVEASDSDAVILQVQPTRPICMLAGQAAASVMLAFERGYRLGGGDGENG